MKQLLPYFGLLAIAVFLFWSFTPKKSKADKVIAKAIAKHGGKVIENSKISFDFRKRHYVATRNGGAYAYERIFTDKENQKVHDVLSNNSFTRTINGEKVDLSQERVDAFSNSINSVIYFALLPYNLKDPAVIKNYLGEEIIDNRAYHKIKVTFRQNGGGKDHDDEYIYWIHREKYTLDFLAYNYQVDGGGARFRSAYNIRNTKGIRFADYINYKPLEKDNFEVATFAKLLQEKQLKELSRIATENVKVEILK